MGSYSNAVTVVRDRKKKEVMKQVYRFHHGLEFIMAHYSRVVKRMHTLGPYIALVHVFQLLI